ncbi:MAG: hypothetical protein MHM6MM_009206, partial [Cercozoa sp. M6MM]
MPVTPPAPLQTLPLDASTLSGVRSVLQRAFDVSNQAQAQGALKELTQLRQKGGFGAILSQLVMQDADETVRLLAATQLRRVAEQLPWRSKRHEALRAELDWMREKLLEHLLQKETNKAVCKLLSECIGAIAREDWPE